MNLHLKTALFILSFVCIGIVVTISAHNFPFTTLAVVAVTLFIAFYNLIYSLLKIEKSIDELKKK